MITTATHPTLFALLAGMSYSGGSTFQTGTELTLAAPFTQADHDEAERALAALSPEDLELFGWDDETIETLTEDAGLSLANAIANEYYTRGR